MAVELCQAACSRMKALKNQPPMTKLRDLFQTTLMTHKEHMFTLDLGGTKCSTHLREERGWCVHVKLRQAL